MRLTLDYDVNKGALSEMSFARKVKLIRKMFPSHRIIVRPSSGGGGWHVIVHDACSSVQELFSMRRWLADDPLRLAMDMSRWAQGLPFNILFTRKVKRGCI